MRLDTVATTGSADGATASAAPDPTCYVRRAVALTETGTLNLLHDELARLLEPKKRASP
jgi:hypothetical protein